MSLNLVKDFQKISEELCRAEDVLHSDQVDKLLHEIRGVWQQLLAARPRDRNDAYLLLAFFLNCGSAEGATAEMSRTCEMKAVELTQLLL